MARLVNSCCHYINLKEQSGQVRFACFDVLTYTVTAAIILMYGCYDGIMGSFPSFTGSLFGIEHTGENYGFVMLGIVIATCGAPALSGFITGKGYGMHVVL